MTAQESLLPCPFCGGEKIGWAVVDTVCVLGCDTCNAYVEEVATTGSEARAKAEEAWNRRAALPAQPVARTPLSDELPKGFLSDVLTAAGLVSHGKQCKALGSRIGEAVESIWKISIQQREALPTHGITQEKQG